MFDRDDVKYSLESPDVKSTLSISQADTEGVDASEAPA